MTLRSGKRYFVEETSFPLSLNDIVKI